MKCLVVAFCYNERKYIEDFVHYYRHQGCDLFILDNHSTDGTYEWLVANRVATKILPTGGQFHLKKLQRGLLYNIKEINPDWVVYSGIDVFFSFDKTVRETIEEADQSGHNLIGVKYFNMYNTGEKRTGRMFDDFYYGRDLKKLYMIGKYTQPFDFEADSIQIDNKKIFQADGVVINYGNTKPAKEREDTYRRRKKAWDHGLDHNYGVHYLEGRMKHWRWDRNELVDIRTTEYGRYIKKLSNDISRNTNRSKTGSI